MGILSGELLTRARAVAGLALLASGALALPATVSATCFPVAEGEARILPATWPEPGHVRLTFLGHSSFLIETPAGATAVTDYNGYVRAPEPPRVVTMNNAHDTHYTTLIEPEIEHALKGWGEGVGGFARHDVKVEDLRVRNVPTNVRNFGGTRYNGNSIFVFEVEDLCIAHLGHLHHELTDDHLGKLGIIDVLLVPVDGSWTASHQTMARVVEQIGAPVIVPMHYFNASVLARFIDLIDDRYEPVINDSPTIELARATLPYRKMIVLPGM
jgi:L-ascorbate metabolism protein UlaG (beta-lactamase superfamily)